MTSDLKKQILIQYLKYKVEEEDWHGVSDAANDLRELEIQLGANAEIAAVEDMVESYIKKGKK